MNSENSKTSDPYRPLLDLSGKIKLKISDKYVYFIKSSHLLYMEKHKKGIQKQQI